MCDTSKLNHKSYLVNIVYYFFIVVMMDELTQMMAVSTTTRFTGEGWSWRKLCPLLHLLPVACHHLLH